MFMLNPVSQHLTLPMSQHLTLPMSQHLTLPMQVAKLPLNSLYFVHVV